MFSMPGWADSKVSAKKKVLLLLSSVLDLSDIKHCVAAKKLIADAKSCGAAPVVVEQPLRFLKDTRNFKIGSIISRNIKKKIILFF